MADDETTEAPVEEKPAEPPVDVEKQAFLDRLDKESGKRKEAEKRAKALEVQFAELQAKLQEREEAGLPELERERKRAETLERKMAEAEKRAEEADQRLQLTQRERWVAAAAAKLAFIDPDDAVRYVDLEDIEDADQAESAVKRVAKAKEHLVRDEDPKLPGRVLENGRDPVPAKTAGGIDQNAEATSLADQLKRFSDQWSS